MTSAPALPTLETVTLERDGHVLLIGLNRPKKRNSFDRTMLAELSRAYGVLESDDSLRAGVLFAHGDHFTAGLDLVDVGPGIAAGQLEFPDDGRDPWRLDGPRTPTPLVAVAHGWCMTLGIELLLAADIRIAATGTRFTQLEVQRGIYPFGGATIRLPREAGWGNAMRWLLTGDEFDAAEAHRIGLVQEVADDAPLPWPGPARSRTPLPSAPHRWVCGPPWRPRTWRAPRVRRPRSSDCGPPSPSFSAARTPPRACSRSSNDGRPDSRAGAPANRPNVTLA